MNTNNNVPLTVNFFWNNSQTECLWFYFKVSCFELIDLIAYERLLAGVGYSTLSEYNLVQLLAI